MSDPNPADHIFVEEHQGYMVVRIVCPKCSHQERYHADTIKADHDLPCPSCGEVVTLAGDGIPRLCRELDKTMRQAKQLFK